MDGINGDGPAMLITGESETQMDTAYDDRRAGANVLINGDGPAMIITGESDKQMGTAYYDRRAGANVLSFSTAVDNFDRVLYDSEMDEFLIRVSSYSRAMRFRRDFYTGMYVSSIGDDGDVFEMEDVAALVTTVEDRLKQYSRREIKKAEIARELQRKFYFLADGSLEDLLRRGKIKNTEVTAMDVARARDIWGPSLGGLKGRSTAQKGKPISLGEKLRTKQHREQVLHADLMFVNGIPYLISVLDPLEYVQVTRLKSKDDWTLWRVLEAHVRFPERFGLKTVLVRVDGESAMSSDFFMAKLQGLLDMSAAGVAVPVVERKIRTVKERIRSVLNTLPFELTEKLEEWLVRGATYSINLVPTRNSYDYSSPREKLFGATIDASYDLKHAFGDYAQVHEENTDNSMAGRTTGCICLMPTGSLDGSWYYWSLRTNKILRRRRATSLPMPWEVIDAVRAIARKRKGFKGKDIRISLDKWNIGEGAAEPALLDQAVAPEFVIPADQRPDEDLIDLESVDDDSDTGSVASNKSQVERNALIDDIFGEDSDEEEELVLDADQVAAIAAEADGGHLAGEQGLAGEREYGRGQRRRMPDGFYSRLTGSSRFAGERTSASDAIYGLKISVNEAVNKFGYEAVLSIVKEIKQMVDGEVFDGVDAATLTADDWRTVISSMLFLKEKYTAEGIFQKLKARLVAGGHQQEREMYGDSNAPTVATQTVFMVAAIAAVEGRAVAAVDVPGAFLKASVPDTDPPIYMKLDKFLTAVLVKLDNNYLQYVRKDGTCIVKLNKTLYGTIQAAKAWYDKLSADLIGLGFKINPADICCFNRIEADGNQTTIIVHVDDMFITGATELALDALIGQLDQLYSSDDAKITVQRGKKIEYVGMVFSYGDGNTVTVTMDGYIHDLLEDVGEFEGIADSPATKHLFRVRAGAASLDDIRRERFHSVMAKILYLAKRVRPELLVAVAFLVRRVQNPDEDDWQKMIRLIQYIRGSSELGIRLSAESHLSITSFIDASYGVHFDLKSHTGAVITLGRGPVYAKSTTQKLNTTSSAEAELVALADSGGQVLWTREFLIHQGYDIGAAIIKEDNQSAIQLIQNGKSNSARTRHIAVRYFFLTDRIKSGEIKVEYLNTSDMIADILTKPLQGSMFKRLRALLLNWPMEDEND
jgi:Reverse transcriptase (RNA-dependent DNA polymerase)